MNIEEKSQLIASTIKSRMKECNLTRLEFAILMGVQSSVITKWLSGKHNFTINTLFQIEAVLQFSFFNFIQVRDPVSQWSWDIKKKKR